MKKSFLLLLCSVFLLMGITYAQAVQIRGVVKDAQTEEPLSGVNVYVEDTNVGTATDVDGFFTFQYEPEGAFNLTFSYVGYKSKTITLSPDDDLGRLEVELRQDVFQSEEIVVTGIASRTSKEVAEVAVSRVEAADYTDVTAYQDISQLVTGKIAGVQLKRSSGNVGSGFRFFVRGGGGLFGNEQPIIYVDGVRVDNAEVGGYDVGGQGINALANLNPEDIADIQVLKGPAGAATYGTNGSNGVVLITTKKGKTVTGKASGLSLNYKYLRGFNEQSYEYKEDNFVSYKDANNAFRTGDVTQHTISATGGTNFIKYFTSFDKRFEEGIITNNNMDRKTAKVNLDVFPSDKLSFNFSTSYSLTEMFRPWNDNNIYGVLGNTLLWPNSYSYTDSASIADLSDYHEINRFVGSANFSYTPFQNFEMRVGLGLDESDWREDVTFPYDRPYLLVNDGRRIIFTRQNRQVTFDFNVNYNYELMKNLKAKSTAGTQLFNRKNRTTFLQVEDFGTELITDIEAGGDVIVKDEGKLHQRDAGLFFEQSLSYLNTYFFTMGLRRDYASSIGEEAPAITYPKASLAVRFDKFGFTPGIFNLLKLRLAYGESGQLPSPDAPIPFLWTAASGGYGSGAVIDQIGNEEIEPERIKEIEIGFESEIMTNYALEFTYYTQNASNSIVFLEESPSTGLTASGIPYNIGAMENWGIESLFRASPLRTPNYELNLNLIWNYQTNEVTDLGGAQPIFDGFDVNVIKEGLPKHQFYTFEVIGPEFNDDGTYSTTNATEERVDLGSPIPEQTGSFSLDFRFLKNFRLYAMSDWALGHKVFNYTLQFPTRLGNNPEFNKLANQLDLAGKTAVAGLIPVDTTVARLDPGSDAYRSAANRFAMLDWRYDSNYIEDASYFKLREISVSYSFRDILAKFPRYRYVNDVIVGFSAYNLLTVTDYNGADPEVNFDGSRSLSRGVDFLTLQNPKVYNFWLRVAL